MENATNGLMMAGSILIGIIVISLFAYMFSSMGFIAKDFQETIDSNSVLKFNEAFEKYITRETTSGEKLKADDLLTAHDLLTVYNLAQEKNRQAGIDIIEIKFEGINFDINDMTKFLTKDEKLYYCVSQSLRYNEETGKISYMEFREAPRNTYEI